MTSDRDILRDSVRKGLLNWNVMLTGFGFVIFLYGTALPAGLLYQRNPRYEWLFIDTLCVDAVVFISDTGCGASDRNSVPAWPVLAANRIWSEQCSKIPS